MTPRTTGIIAITGACVIWGLSPLYYKLLAHVPPLELLAHRTLWSLVGFAGLLVLQGRLGRIRAALASRRDALTLTVAALLISANWFLFIFSVQVGRVTETSMGYYMQPLLVVLLGVFVLKERLGGAQWLAIGLAAAGVAQLTWGLGQAPWISLTLATTFALYGLLKKRLAVGAVVSVTTEVLILAPLAVGWLVWVHLQGGGLFGTEAYTTALLLLSGVLTALPLILFSAGAQRVSMVTLGLVQYLNPTMQFVCAAVIFAEPLTGWHVTAFAMIWTALAIYTAVTLTQERARRRMAMTAPAEAPVWTKSSSERSANP
jgi:chloramphenicol-sensitive protein RarD